MTKEIRTVSSTGGEKGQKEARYDLIPVDALEYVARLYGKGAQKYAERNWERGYDWNNSYAALQRHANQFWAGEDYDSHEEDCEENCSNHTGLPHMAAVCFHALALLEFMKTHQEFDNRPYKENK